MKIGIDAKWYFEGPPSGKMVIQNIVDELLRRKILHKIYLILDKKFVDKKELFVGENIYPIFIWGRNNLLSNVFLMPFIARKYKLDIVVYQNFSSFFGKHKKIAYIHDILFKSHPQFYTMKEKLYFLPLKLLANMSDSIITVSENEKKRLIKYGYKKPIQVIYHGVSELFKPKELFSHDYLNKVKIKYKLPEKYLLYVGRLNVRKNIANLFKAISLLNSSQKLVIVGKEDWKMFDFNAMLNNLKIRDKIIFTGSISNEELSAVYSMSSVFIFPSFAEAFGLPPLEAMASGIPIVVSNATCIPEICGDAGYYVNPNSPEEIAEQIILAINDNELKKKRIELGLRRAAEFTWEKTVDKIIKLCESIITTNENINRKYN
ncbi:MAG: glycosyltransferase family 4 protein [Stygiobacter sp.]